MKLTSQKVHLLPTGVLGMTRRLSDGHLFCACVDGGIYAVDPETGANERFAAGHESYASGCVLTLPGQIVSAGYDGVLIWHDVVTREEIRRVKAHHFWSWQLAVSPGGGKIASATGQYLAGGEKYEPAAETEPSVRVFDAADGRETAAFSHGPPVQCLAFSPDGMHLAAANIMGEVRVWELATGKTAAQWTAPDLTSWGTIKSHHFCGGAHGLAFSPDGNAILLCGMGPMTDPMAGNGRMTWQRWAWRESAPRMIDRNKDGEHGSGLMEALAWHPSGRQFVMAGRMAQGTWNAAVFSADDGGLITSVDTKMRITEAVFSADGRHLFLAGATGQSAPRLGLVPPWGRVFRYDVEV